MEPNEEIGRAKGTSQASERMVRIGFCLPLVFTGFVSLLVLLRDEFPYSFLLLDDPQDTTVMASGIESVLVNLVGQIPRLDGPVGCPLVYASGGSCLAGLVDFFGCSEAITRTQGF